MAIFALLIGINNYHPDSKVRSLSGCHGDVTAMHKFLLECCADQIKNPAQQIRVLLDDKATRKGVIDAFRSHLGQAGPEDAVLIFFAGHGAQNKTAEAFKPFSIDGMDEGWVLYDSRLPGSYDLADKELAWLLEGISKYCPHITFISDSCHSGSVSRDIVAARYVSGLDTARPLESYLEGAYVTPGAESKKIPTPRHILLAACDKEEVAMESFKSGGYFTSSLLNVLQSCKGRIDYRNLFLQISSAIRSLTQLQHPQAEPHDGFDAYSGFLGFQVPRQRPRYPVYMNGNQWRTDIGAGHGLAPVAGKPIPVEVYDAPVGGSFIEKTEIVHVGVSHSILKMQDNTALAIWKSYWAELDVMPSRQLFLFCSDSSIRALLEHGLFHRNELPVRLVSQMQEADLRLEVKEGNLLLYEQAADKFIQGIAGINESTIDHIFKILEQLALWHRLKLLRNPTSKLLPGHFPLHFFVKNGDKWDEVFTNPAEISFDGNPLDFRFTTTNQSTRPVYAALVYLNPKYGISILYNDTNAIPPGSQEIRLLEDYFQIPATINSETDFLVFLISTAPIDLFSFSKPDLEPVIVNAGGRDFSTRSIGGLSELDWLSKTWEIRLNRK